MSHCYLIVVFSERTIQPIVQQKNTIIACMMTDLIKILEEP